jgi:hypothetical protein
MLRGLLVSRVGELDRESSATASCPRVGTVPGDNQNVEESPEQVLARLVRYRDSLNRTPGSLPRALNHSSRSTAPGSPVVVWGAGDRAGGETVPAPSRVWRYSRGRELVMTLSTVRATLVGHLVAVLGCTFAVIAFERTSSSVAVGVVIVATAVGLTALARRVPLAVWWTLGVVIGGALGRWS